MNQVVSHTNRSLEDNGRTTEAGVLLSLGGSLHPKFLPKIAFNNACGIGLPPQNDTTAKSVWFEGGSTCVYRAVKRLGTTSSNQAASVYLAVASEPGLAPKRLWPCGQASREAHQRPSARPDVVATPLSAAPTEHPSFCAIFPSGGSNLSGRPILSIGERTDRSFLHLPARWLAARSCSRCWREV